MREPWRFHPIADMSGAWVTLLLISGFVNVLALAGAIYMLQVYDRVLTSHSIETLIALSAMVGGLYVVLGALDAIRSQMLLRVGERFDAKLMPHAHRCLLAGGGRQGMSDAVQAVRDVDVLRSFHAGPAPVALLDLPWGPIFLCFVWALSPLLGMVTLACLLILLGLAAISQWLARGPEQAASRAFAARFAEIDAACRTAEATMAMGMQAEVQRRYLAANEQLLDAYRRAADIAAIIGATSKVVRLLLQTGIIGLGAWLTIGGELTAGAIMAASIAATRALAPVEQAIGGWKALNTARASLGRLRSISLGVVATPDQLSLPDPRAKLAVERIAVVAPIGKQVILRNISFEASAGTVVAVVGPSGSGKSTLARALTGVWPLAHGTVTLDDAPLRRWSEDELGRHVGYMPQSNELFPGTIAENIARLEQPVDATLVIEASRGAGVHQTILALPDGYETRIAGDGTPLSAGQRQQIGLARALYGNPFLVVLDEPNASLDSQGEEALRQAIVALKRRGAVVVVMAHRRSLLSVVDRVAVLEAGQLKSFGPPAEVLSAHVTPIRSTAVPVRESSARDRPLPEGAVS